MNFPFRVGVVGEEGSCVVSKKIQNPVSSKAACKWLPNWIIFSGYSGEKIPKFFEGLRCEHNFREFSLEYRIQNPGGTRASKGHISAWQIGKLANQGENLP